MFVLAACGFSSVEQLRAIRSSTRDTTTKSLSLSSFNLPPQQFPERLYHDFVFGENLGGTGKLLHASLGLMMYHYLIQSVLVYVLLNMNAAP